MSYTTLRPRSSLKPPTRFSFAVSLPAMGKRRKRQQRAVPVKAPNYQRTKQPLGADNATRKHLAAMLEFHNRFSDEYYTRAECWAPFLQEEECGAAPAPGAAVWEPFAGDGACYEMLRGFGLETLGRPGQSDFWANTRAPRGTEWIVTNPPFSSKWLVLDALLENRLPMAVILPWQAFYGNGVLRLDALRARHGGTWSRHACGTHAFNRPDGTTKDVGCYILRWVF